MIDTLINTKMLLQKIKGKLKNIQNRLTPKKWKSKSIVYYTGATSHEWTPDSLVSGIGGAEGRIIYLAKEWVKLGYEVTVYNNCGSKEGIYDSVQYLNYRKFNPYDQFDILIMWQFAWRLKFPIKANKVWLDLGQGVLLPEQVTYDKLKGYDTIFCKNKYHRSLLPEIPDSLIAIIPNGLDSKFINLKKNPKQPNKIIYASNYSRGLEYMLRFGWPIIKRELPEAELHIYYGWSKNVESDWKKAMLELMKQPGVTEHGKVGREKLMEEKSTSTINYYGCTFDELDCNTVRESAFVGCVPVTTNYAGLQDKDYCIKVSGHPYKRETQEALAYKIVELLKNVHQLEKLREECFELVQNETWEKVAKLWLDMV